MDVVREVVDDIGGKITVTSKLAIGTKITLELPMSVALTSVFHVKLGINNYAIAMDNINETVQVLKDEIEYINKKPMLKLRGSLIPLNFHYNLLSKDIDKNEYYSLVIIEVDNVKFGLIVDEFVNQLDIVQKPLAEHFKNHPFISGTSLLGNGKILFVINPIKLINLKEKR
jgi:two-component system chemotaxis sensor kinase CheA